MKLDQYEKAMRAIAAIFGSMHTKHWVCFGNLLHLVRDSKIDDDHDIDIGIFYEEMDGPRTILAFEKYGYKLAKKIINDVDGRYFYLSFEYEGQRDLPPVDVFAWFKHGDNRYHTYDVHHEGREIPSQYVFKGVPDKYLPTLGSPSKLDPKMCHLFFGKWNAPMFQQEIPVPFFMGTLLDIWYPNWLKPVKMQSISPYTVTMKSCKQWADENHVNSELVAAGIKYNEERLRLK